MRDLSAIVLGVRGRGTLFRSRAGVSMWSMMSAFAGPAGARAWRLGRKRLWQIRQGGHPLRAFVTPPGVKCVVGRFCWGGQDLRGLPVEALKAVQAADMVLF